MTGKNAGQPWITLTKPQNQLHNQTQARCGVLFIFHDQVDTGNQAIFDKLNEAIEHACLAREMTVQSGLGDANRRRQFCRRDALTSIAGFKHQCQRLKYFFATIPFRGLFFCHVAKYP